MKVLMRKLDVHNKQDFKELIKQTIKFSIVGLLNTLIFLFVYYLLVFLNVHYIIANIVAFMVSVVNAYYWNSKYVFVLKEGEKRHLSKTFIKVTLAYGFTFLLSTGLLVVWIDLLGISKYIGPLINLLITVPTNFLINKFWAMK